MIGETCLTSGSCFSHISRVQSIKEVIPIGVEHAIEQGSTTVRHEEQRSAFRERKSAFIVLMKRLDVEKLENSSVGFSKQRIVRDAAPRLQLVLQ